MLRWSCDSAGPFRELVRQQWNFSPPTTTREVEEYNVGLSDVAVLELIIIPDISGGAARVAQEHVFRAASTFGPVASDTT